LSFSDPIAGAGKNRQAQTEQLAEQAVFLGDFQIVE